MYSSVLGRVLTIEEVKQKMKDIREAAVHYGGVVHCGERGRDELVIVSAQTWREAITHGEGAGATDAYAGFSRALTSGLLGRGDEAPVTRRRIAGLKTESGVPVEQMVAAGSERMVVRRRKG